MVMHLKRIQIKKKSKTEKVDTFVEKVESNSPYVKLSEAFGGIEKLPENFKPINQIIQQPTIGEPYKKSRY